HIQIAHFRLGADLADGFINAGMQTHGQTIACGINLSEQLVEVFPTIAHQVQYRTKHFALEFTERFNFDKSGRNIGAKLHSELRRSISFAATLMHLTPLNRHRLDMPVDTFPSSGVNDRANSILQLRRWPHT